MLVRAFRKPMKQALYYRLEENDGWRLYANKAAATSLKLGAALLACAQLVMWGYRPSIERDG